MKNGFSPFIMSKMVDEKWFRAIYHVEKGWWKMVWEGSSENGWWQMVDERRKNGWADRENVFSKIGIKKNNFFQNWYKKLILGAVLQRSNFFMFEVELQNSTVEFAIRVFAGEQNCNLQNASYLLVWFVMSIINNIGRSIFKIFDYNVLLYELCLKKSRVIFEIFPRQNSCSS